MNVVQKCCDPILIDELGFTLTDELDVIESTGKIENPGMPNEKKSNQGSTVVHLYHPSARLFKMMSVIMTMKEGKDTIIFVSDDGKFGIFVEKGGFVDMTDVK